MKKTGIFFHYQDGERLRDFPDALANILNKENVVYYDAHYPCKEAALYDLEPPGDDLLYRVHSKEMINRIRSTGIFPGVLFSAGGTIQAAKEIHSGKISNAFIFTGYGDHHAGRDFYGGGCYINGAALAITDLRNKYGINRFVIVDTDPHHGDGTWDIFKTDDTVLYLCFCHGDYTETHNKINITVPFRTNDEDYLNLLKEAVLKKIERHRPYLLFWNYGYDGTAGEYGDIGISMDCQIEIAKLMKSFANHFCQGRLIVVLCGGSSRMVAAYTIPRIISVLATEV